MNPRRMNCGAERFVDMVVEIKAICLYSHCSELIRYLPRNRFDLLILSMNDSMATSLSDHFRATG